MKHDDDPELWDLLGRAAEPKISPFFARNVLREIREVDRAKIFRGWLSPRRLIPIAGTAAVVIAASLLRLQPSVSPVTNPSRETLTTIDALEYEVIADLEDLVGSDEGSLLEESFLL